MKDESHLLILRWAAFGIAGLYLWKLFESKGLSGNFDAESFVEEGSRVIPHPIAQHPIVKKVAKAYVGKYVQNSYSGEIT